MTNKLIINYTPTGMVPTKEMTPYVPVDINEIVDDVLKACESGITIAHLHAREKDGTATYKKEIYGKIFEALHRFAPELVICLSLSGRNFNEFSLRSQPIELYPDMGSLTLSSLNFTNQASVNSPDMIKDLSIKMKQYGVNPELEVFDMGMINYAKYLISKSLIEGPYYFNIIVGNIAGMQASASEMGLSIDVLPPSSFWAFGGIGSSQLVANSIAISLGGGVRVGLEDNLYFDRKKTRLCTNMDLLKRVYQLAEIHEREIMGSKEFGELGFYNKKLRSI